MSSAVIKKLETILTSEYDIKNYVDLVYEIFPDLHIVAPEKINKENSGFGSYIEGTSHIATFQTSEKKKLLIMAVQLKKDSYVKNARSTHRSYAKKLIENGNADAAFIAFYSEDDPKWRLSLVCLDYEMKIECGRMKVAESLTPAKRYSYLVGKDEPCHTAISRFRKIIIDRQLNQAYLSLDALEEAFSVESVTDEFFELYCEKFQQLRKQLEGIEDFCEEAKCHNFSSEQFAKKLLGQIVFLYFLQKKGWLGVDAWASTLSEDEFLFACQAGGLKSKAIVSQVYCLGIDGKYYLSDDKLGGLDESDKAALSQYVKGNPWGSGSSNFIRELFDSTVKKGFNFYNDVLEPLLYDALNCNRGESSYYSALHCRIPYLTCNLFEPVNGYDWKHSNFCIPNDIFSNKAIDNQGGDGILDIFDRYNFTMSEDAPMDREVAIDPEMLGKVFENLLEVEARKTMGAFYTPREIVRFMCRESLIKYLSSKTQIYESDIREFVQYSELLQQQDSKYIEKSDFEKLTIPKTLFCIDPTGKVCTNRLKDIDDALASVRIIDPAVGSGAFPLCMVNEIVQMRQNITPYMLIEMDKHTQQMYCQSRSSYWLKYSTIRDSIYAVDNEPSAVDITQLRLWLSLIIEEELNTHSSSLWGNSTNPTALPTLEKNIVCGDSLVYKIDSLSPFAQEGLINSSSQDIQCRMNTPSLNFVFEKLFEEQSKLFSCADSEKKKNIRENIQACKDMLLKSGSPDSRDVEEFIHKAKKADKKFVIWQLDFADVFKNNGGFDIVIGNPPYIQLQKSVPGSDDLKFGDLYAHLNYKTFAKSGDLYCLFYELGISLLKKNGCLCYITSNKWMRTAYGKQLRSYFDRKTNPVLLIDFCGTRVFKTAGVDVSIILLEKECNRGRTKVCTIKNLKGSSLETFIEANSSTQVFEGENSWNIISNIEEDINKKILSIGKPLSEWEIDIKYGIKTCLNKVYIVDEKTKEMLCAEDPNSIEILQPVLQGKDIDKWECNFKKQWLIAVHNGIHRYDVPPVNIDKYPAIKNYLTPHIDDLKKKADQGITPYHLKNCTYYEKYSMPKIMFQEIEDSPSFALDAEGKYMCVDTVRIITGKHLEYLVGLLNSNLFFFAVKHFLGGGGLGEKGVRMKHTFFKRFTAYEPTLSEEDYIRDLVLYKPEHRDAAINEFVYKKYKLTADEIEYIEADMKQENR